MMGIFGPPNIEKMKAKKNVRGLIKALGYQKDCYVRQDAAEALGMIGNKRAVKHLIKSLNDDNESVHSNAAWALGQIGDASAVEALTVKLKDKDEVWELRKAVAVALGAIGDPKAVDSLLSVLKDKKHNEYIRGAAAKALGEIGDPRAIDSLTSARKERRVLVCDPAAEALDMIRANRVRDNPRVVRRLARV